MNSCVPTAAKLPAGCLPLSMDLCVLKPLEGRIVHARIHSYNNRSHGITVALKLAGTPNP
jgi:hypothetical protein